MSARWFEALIARRGSLILVAALALGAAGLIAGRTLPSGIYPEVEFPRIVVVARERRRAARRVRRRSLTRPLESALITVLGVERLRARTIRGAVELSLQFAPGTDMWRALQLAESRVAEARAGLPAGAEIVVERLDHDLVSGGHLQPDRRRSIRGALREIGELVLRPALSRVRGVGRIEVLGGDVREVEVVLDPERTAALHLRPTDVAERLRASTVLEAVGRLEESREQVTVMAVGASRARSPTSQRIPIATAADGSPVPLSAIARRVRRRRGSPAARGGPARRDRAAERQPPARREHARRRRARSSRRCARWRPRLPAGVRVEPVYDQAALVAESMASRARRDPDRHRLCVAGHRACSCADLRAGRDRRAGGAAHARHHASLAAALAGQSLNLMSLGGLAVAIGLVIDDAIVVIEAIGRRMSTRESRRAAAALSGPRPRCRPLIGTTRDDGGRVHPARVPARASSGSSSPRWRSRCRRGGHPVAAASSLTLVPLLRASLAARGAAPARRPPARRRVRARAARPACASRPGSRSVPRAAARRASSRARGADAASCRRWTKARSCSTTSCPPAPR